MPFITGTLTITHPSDALDGLEIDLVSDCPTIDRPVPWFARWEVPSDDASRRFVANLLNDDVHCTLSLTDGRVGTFSFAFDGAVLHMQGLHPFRRAGEENP